MRIPELFEHLYKTADTLRATLEHAAMLANVGYHERALSDLRDLDVCTHNIEEYTEELRKALELLVEGVHP